ncbi:hypothetical protein ASPACDRAFT_54469 [Aspergillus aculeatus ATCC 16872]|uniref:Aminoglycoside phosphotransferase domain-containing protein n=1 Tax=Aspergillus aculeatus (strain ATCC 16872 / CBS 172.66 / WB 5094) TaxID=690307 RepID=A0A1L9WKB7_ASPA1|nr:uncharacterized protein ASPACDRAFT_54469 [Aspergillus aculeatus ATCC 16872]OJJ96596.1 hypothetical protein ASPACDRAFT_54469 [Aspergillus aculeatus ATCC 16872]
MDFDDINLTAVDNLRLDWIKLASKSGAGICELANRYRQRDDCMLHSMHCGSFNFSFRLNWDDQDEDWLIRFPLPGKSMFLDEKVRREAFVMNYIAKETKIPVPRVIAHGTSDENSTGLGPFIIMTWIEGRKMSDILRQDDLSDKHDVLDPAIDPETLKTLYGEMAEVLLQRWGLDFSKIGSINEDHLGKTIVDGRPLTRELNELIRISGLKDCTPQRTFHTSIDYIASLLELQSTHLEQQRNKLMKAIALNFIPKDDCGPFKLFCDDLCPGNVLVDDSLRIVGVLDWEFTYAAPSQFAASIPWWLLLRRPHSLVNQDGPDVFLQSFLLKANIFLEALEERERTRALTKSDDRLSVRMRRSLEDRSAWFTLALHMGASVDLIYWDLLDEYCWGPRSSIAHRVHAVTTLPEMHKRREDFVREKIRQLRAYYKELGRDDEVEYEPELPLAQVVEGGPAPQSQQASGIANGGLLEGVLAGLAVGLGFTIFVKWYRS